MTAHAEVPLDEICAINPRAKRSGYSNNVRVSFVPMAAVDERLGAIIMREDRCIAEVSKGYTAFQDGDVLFAKITPCMENGKAALAQNLTNGMGSGSTEFHVLRPGERVLGEYLYHFVRQSRFREEARRNFTGTAGQQRVPKSFMQSALIPLPPLDEQRRIVGILNRAAKIERLRAQAQERLREFIPALFVKMFGDPATNPMGWETISIDKVCAITGGGTPRRNNAAYFGGSILWATPTDITALSELSIESTKETITEAGLCVSSARLVPAGAVLLTSRATIGDTAIAAVPMATNQGFANFICGERLLPEYLAIWLRLRRDYLIQLAGGTTFKEVSKSALKKITIPLPSLEAQRRFVVLAHKTYGISEKCRDAAASEAALSASLMCRLLEDV